MQNGKNKNLNRRYSRPPAPYVDRLKRWSSNSSHHRPKSPHDAQRNYERYLALAQAEVRTGNVIGAENYYQHAEHYFRTMSAERGTV